MRPSAALALVLVSTLAACDRKPAATSPYTTPAAPPAPKEGPPVMMAPPAVKSSAPSGETTYWFGAGDTKTTINYESKTSITTITGTSTKVEGFARIDFEKSAGTCELKVPVLALVSASADRDRAMFGPVWLDAKQFPTIEFKAEKATKKDDKTWTIDGKFSLHGVTKDVSVVADVRPIPDATAKNAKLGEGAWVKVKTDFTVKLSDYGIKIPENSIGQVRDEIAVGIDLFGTTAKPAYAAIEDPTEKVVRAVPAPKVSADGLEGTIYFFGKKPQLAQMVASSDMELEKITATSKTLGGVLGLDRAKNVGKVRLALPVKSLRTGIAARDEHMLSADWLDEAQFKLIEFESTKATKKDERTWTVEGTFKLHGVAKPVALDVTLRDVPLELVKKSKWGETAGVGFMGTFKIKLSEFGLKVPEVATLKVNDEWTVTFDIIALEKEPG